MNDTPRITGIARLGLDAPKRGAKPREISSVYVRRALEGRDCGIYQSAEQAAYAIAVDEFNNDRSADGFEAFRKLLVRRFSQLFS